MEGGLGVRTVSLIGQAASDRAGRQARWMADGRHKGQSREQSARALDMPERRRRTR